MNNMYKILIVGKLGAGRDTIIRKLCFRTIVGMYKHIDIAVKALKLNHNGQILQVPLYFLNERGDPSAQIRKYIKKVDAVIIVGDVSSTTFQFDVLDIRSQITRDLPCFCVCNKIDLHEVTQSVVLELHDKFTNVFPMSVETCQGLDEAFQLIAEALVERGRVKYEDDEEGMKVIEKRFVEEKKTERCC